MREEGAERAERQARPPFGLAKVSGPSMVPTLRHGDQLFIRYGARVRPGDVVVLRHPLRQDLLIVKRAVERRDGGWWVLGDNQFAESDSRAFGTVPDELVLARVLGRFRPPGELRPWRSLAAAIGWAASALRRVRRHPAGSTPARARSRRLRAR